MIGEFVMVYSLASFRTMCIDTLQGHRDGNKKCNRRLGKVSRYQERKRQNFNFMKNYAVEEFHKKKNPLELPNIWKNKRSCP